MTKFFVLIQRPAVFASVLILLLLISTGSVNGQEQEASQNLPVPGQGQEAEAQEQEASQNFPVPGQDQEAEAQEQEASQNLPVPGQGQEAEAQEQEASQSLPASAQSEEAVEAEDESGGKSDFISNSLKYDIKTSRKEELIAWCRVLNLPDDGTDDQLKNRLHEYYTIKDSENSDAVTDSGNQVIIKSAKRSEYFEVSITGGEKEPVVKLTGNVVLTVSETKRSRTHEVKADSILFNEGSNTISAVGNIEYIVDTNGRKERFTGDSLTFDVNDWTGIIFHGTSERKEEIDKKEVPFFFRGDSIKRASANIMVLYNGSISSTDTDNPDYALKAKKIWITGPGEWSIFSATIYVGHVPMLYLPFYWKSGRDMFFNPVIGQRTDKGYYIQTTAYLIGQKEDDDGFSMLGFGDSAGGEYELVREGLYLVKKPAETKDQPDTETKSKTNHKNSLKYMLDAYTGLGAATGLTGTFPELGDNGKLDFYSSIGVSRSIDADGKTYFLDGATPQTYWNSTQLGTATLPFRWGSWVNFSYKKWKLHFSWYSDPYYTQDFGDREENFDWLRLLLSEEDETEKKTSISTLKWELAGTHSFNLKKLSPWLSAINISHLKMSLRWKNKSNTNITASTNPDRSVNPARSFYYPDQLILPDVKIVVRGALPNYTVKRKKKEIPEGDSSSPQDEGQVSDENTSSIDRPNIIGDFTGIYSSNLFEASLKYDLDSRFYMEDSLLSSDWDDPSDINFHDFKGTKINTIQQGNIHYGLNFWDGLIGFNGTTKLSGYYQVHEPFFGTKADIEDTTKLEDYKYTKFNWENILSLKTHPLQGIPSLSATEIKYSIDANILNYSFKDGATVDNPLYMLNWIENKEDIKKHEAAAFFKFKRSPVSFSADFISNVPPLDVKYTAKFAAGLDYRGFKVGIDQKNTFEEEEWKNDPINMTASWKGWKDEVEFAQTAQFAVEENRFSKVESILKFWGFKTRFVASHTKTYDWNLQTNSWTAGEEAFVPSLLEFSFSRTFSPKPSWRNRIKIKTVIDTSWKINLIKPTDNVLRFKWTQQLDIHKFLSLKITFSAINRSMYLYFPEWREQFGITAGTNNFFEDLLKSFNIFRIEDRIESQFNMERISVGMVHHLRNWDVSLEYSGWPKLNKDTKIYDWEAEFSIYVKWNPLPLFNQKTTFKDDVWSVESFGDNIDFE